MEQGRLTYALFFEPETGILANIHRTKVITHPSPRPLFILIDIQEDNYNYKLEKQNKHFCSV